MPSTSYEKVTHPHDLTSPVVAVVVLVIAIVLEGHALRTAAREANRTRGQAQLVAIRPAGSRPGAAGDPARGPARCSASFRRFSVSG